MAKKKSFAAALRADIFQKLEASLTDLKALTSEKSFQARLTKAAKILTEDIKEQKAPQEQEAAPKKKAAVKKGKKLTKPDEVITAQVEEASSQSLVEQPVEATNAKNKSLKK